MAALYLIPNTLGESELDKILPTANTQIIRDIKHFIVEDIRNTRRFLKKNDRNIDIDTLQFYELNKHSDPRIIGEYLAPIKQGMDVGIISEAGCPGVADPGADVVRIAHQLGIEVRPLVGPSSIILAMMASGLNGQNFAFVGYIPIQKQERIKRLKDLEARAIAEKQTQLFIETPYRNTALFDDILASCRPETLVCVARGLTTADEFVRTMPVSKWRNKKPVFDKQPTIFLIGV
ncbi:MAG: hypothetical protein RIS47_756 [Bacteroidota bacterium]|jgi:16S rRNA (cytidine1402-2'-O)-methyltransferase